MTLTSTIPAEWTMSIGCEWSHWQEHFLETILAGGFVNRAGNGHPYTTILGGKSKITSWHGHF